MENKESEVKQSPFKSVLVMRHGERIDCIDENSKQLLSEYDPELTEKGIKQAQDIGNKLKKYLNKEINTVNLYSSPFTRTIMTGLNVIKELNLENNNIYIVKNLFEVSSENNFKYFPLDTLLINNKEEKNDLYQKFINNNLQNLQNCDGIKEFNIKESVLKYPEAFNDAINRYKIATDEIVNNSQNSLNIIVTHGYGVQVITEGLFKRTNNEQELLDNEMFFVDYCTSYFFEFIDEKKVEFIERIEPSAFP